MLAGKLRAATAGAEGLPIEDLFSTYLYTGNGSTQTITNGIDLAGEGGMVWVKNRSTTATAAIVDTERGASYFISPSETAAQAYNTTANINALNSDGFTVGTGNYTKVNGSGYDYASWTFRKAPKFFDVVTWTGDGASNRAISHSLGSTPGMVIVKRTNTTEDWAVWNRNLPVDNVMYLNKSNAIAVSASIFGTQDPDDFNFYVGNHPASNNLNDTYVAYLFAHNDGDGEFGPNGDQDIIKCGSYVGGGTTNRTVTLGWEPQWVLIKKTTTTGNWQVYDNMRGMDYSGQSKYLFPNLSSAEGYIGPASSGGFEIRPTPTGFELAGDASTGGNHLNQTYIYIAIRRGPMREPTVGTEVFAADSGNNASTAPFEVYTSGFPVDLSIQKYARAVSSASCEFIDRLRGPRNLSADTAAAETTTFDGGYTYEMDSNSGINTPTAQNISTGISWMFRRAPGFFDVVAYTGDGTAGRTVPHNLGVAPEMMIAKRRDGTNSWVVYYKHDATTYRKMYLEQTASYSNLSSGDFNSTLPTDSVITLGSTGRNRSGYDYIAYLFATLPGVSKVGSYTGNGSSQTIDCGFTTGARFILIKRTDSTGDWYVWDTARGIVTGDDPHLSLNTTAAEVTNDDSIDPDSSGFIVNQVAATDINVSSASYIYLAIS